MASNILQNNESHKSTTMYPPKLTFSQLQHSAMPTLLKSHRYVTQWATCLQELKEERLLHVKLTCMGLCPRHEMCLLCTRKWATISVIISSDVNTYQQLSRCQTCDPKPNACWLITIIKFFRVTTNHWEAFSASCQIWGTAQQSFHN